MLPTPNRLPSPQIKSVMRRGRRVSVGSVQLIVAHNALGLSRFAFVVPISMDKRAVVRNRVRRLMRESVRLALSVIAPGRDGVFLIRKGLPDEFAAVDTLIRDLLRRADMA